MPTDPTPYLGPLINEARDQFEAYGTAVDADYAEQIEALGMEVDAAELRAAAAQKKYDDHMAEFHPKPPDPEPVLTTLMGSSIPFDVMGRHPVDLVRFYLQQLGKPWGGYDITKKAEGFDPEVIWVSWKDEDPEDVATLLADIPSGREVWATHHHEPENDLTVAQSANYRAKWRDMSAVIREAGAIPTLCLMRYTLTKSSGRNWRDWYPGDEAVDILGWDAYRKGDAGVVQPAVENMIDPIIAVSLETGKPWAIGETGSTTKRYTEKDTVAYASALRAYGAENKARGMAWWDQDDFKLTEAVAKAWLD